MKIIFIPFLRKQIYDDSIQTIEDRTIVSFTLKYKEQVEKIRDGEDKNIVISNVNILQFRFG